MNFHFWRNMNYCSHFSMFHKNFSKSDRSTSIYIYEFWFLPVSILVYLKHLFLCDSVSNKEFYFASFERKFEENNKKIKTSILRFKTLSFLHKIDHIFWKLSVLRESVMKFGCFVGLSGNINSIMVVDIKSL